MSKLKIKIDIMRRPTAWRGVNTPSDTIHIWLDGYPDQEAEAKLLADQIEHKLQRALPGSAMVLHIDYGTLGQGPAPELAVREMVERGEMPGRHLVLVSGDAGLRIVGKVGAVVSSQLMDGLTTDELESLQAQLASQMAAQS